MPQEARVLDDIFGLFGVKTENEGRRLYVFEDLGIVWIGGECGVVRGPGIAVGRR